MGTNYRILQAIEQSLRESIVWQEEGIRKLEDVIRRRYILLSDYEERLDESENPAETRVLKGKIAQLQERIKAAMEEMGLAQQELPKLSTQIQNLWHLQEDTFNQARTGSLEPGAFLRLSIDKNPLPAHYFALAVSSFTELYTKCWLIQQGRFADLIDYTLTHQPRFAKEANLLMAWLSYSSPAMIFLAGVSQTVGEALRKTLEAVLQAPRETIDAVIQTPERKEARKLENQAAIQALEQQEREARLHEWEREIELRERQAATQLRIAEARFKTVDIAVEHAVHLVELLHPEADPRPKRWLPARWCRNY